MADPTVTPAPVGETSVIGYVIGVLLVVVAPFVFIVLFFESHVDLGEELQDFDRIPAPATEVIVLEPGDYVVYGEDYTAPTEVDVAIDTPSAPVALAPYIGDLTYTFDRATGRALSTFTVETAGPHRVGVDEVEGVVVAIGPSVRRAVGLTAWLAPLVGLGLFLVGIGLIVMTARGRRRHRRRDWLGASVPSSVPGAPRW